MSSPLSYDPLVLPLIDGYTILDVGCGRGKWGYLLRVEWCDTQKGNYETEPEYLVGVDIFLPSLRWVKRHKTYDDVVLCDVLKLPFKKDSFDVVLAAEILEHLEKDKGTSFLKDIETISKRTIVVTTPNNPKLRGGLETPNGFNYYERHASKWSADELRSLGYQVQGIGLNLFEKLVLWWHHMHAMRAMLFFAASAFTNKLFPQFACLLVAKKHKTLRSPKN